MKELYPICNSITGNGVVRTFEIINKLIPLEILSVNSGDNYFNWTVPDEWNINEAFIENNEGEKIVDFNNLNIHVVNYSEPIDVIMDLDELKNKIYTIPKHPDYVPYLTSYYNKDWGFCLSQNQFDKLKPGKYRVFIDSELKKGLLRYGEITIPGKSDNIVLLSTYICHPSMCNDNLSGVTILTEVVKNLIKKQNDLNYTYKCIFIPETIGSIIWLARNQLIFKKIIAGLNLTCLGNKEELTYKKSRIGDSKIDRVAQNILHENSRIIDFYPTGSDERQYCSPGINLPVGTLMRGIPATFPEYHTSADNLEFVDPDYLYDSYENCLKIIMALDQDKKYINNFPMGEPQLGKFNLYRKIGSQKVAASAQNAFKWLLNYSDGKHSLLDVSYKSGIDFFDIVKFAEILADASLLSEFDE